MINPLMIIITGLVAALLCVATWFRYRGGFAPIMAVMFLVMAGGSVSITLFYVGVRLGAPNLPHISRWLWLAILLSTAFMAISVLVLKKGNGRNE